MKEDNITKEDLNDVPYEIGLSLDDKCFIDQHSILCNTLIYFYVLFFYGFSIFIIHRIIHSLLLNKNYFLTGECKNFISNQCSCNFTNIPLKNAHLTIEIKLYLNLKYFHDLDALFIISTFPEKQLYLMKSFDSSSNRTNNSDIIETSIIKSDIFEQDILQMKYISVQSYFSDQIHNISKAELTIQMTNNLDQIFIQCSNLYLAFTTLLFMITKLCQLTKIEDLKLYLFIPLIFLSFCTVSSFPIFILDNDYFTLVQNITNSYLSTLFFEISFSFIFFTIYSLPINFFESILDFFLSILILIYSFIFQIFRLQAIETNPNTLLLFLYITYFVRNIQKGYNWFIIRNKQTIIRSFVYPFINIITISIMFICYYLMPTNENKQMFHLLIFASLISYSITMVIYNSP